MDSALHAENPEPLKKVREHGWKNGEVEICSPTMMSQYPLYSSVQYSTAHCQRSRLGGNDAPGRGW
jgi:hypothetical protein